MSKRKIEPEYTNKARNTDIKEMVRRSVLPLDSGIQMAPNAFSNHEEHSVWTVFHQLLPGAILRDDELYAKREVERARSHEAHEAYEELMGRNTRPPYPHANIAPGPNIAEKWLQDWTDEHNQLSSDLASGRYYPAADRRIRDAVYAASMARQKGLPEDIGRELASFF